MKRTVGIEMDETPVRYGMAMGLCSLFVGLVIGVPAARADDDLASTAKHFETAIRPVLIEHCLKCHGSEKQWGSLRLDSKAALLKGGDSGPAIVPGSPEQSRLIQAIRHADADLKMPPAPNAKLTDKQIADFVVWIKQGAVFPETNSPAAKRSRDPNHWAFLRVGRPTVPGVQKSDWPETEFDCFILSRLEAAGLQPASKVDRRALLRRITFDLIGLPPSEDEIADFLEDDRPDATERLIDRLLASPAYGERWGRHWLDVARYADSNGLDENVAHGNAWRYRDYVIDSLNRDTPYDRFLAEQIAGDLLPAADAAERNRNLIATGFLSIGPKVLAEVDEAKMQMDIVDEQIDTVGRALLGLTLGCARCHDHKFDPIETTDYYALAGIFKSTRTMEHFKKVAKWYENQLDEPASAARKKAYDEELVRRREAIKQFVEVADRAVKEANPAGVDPQSKPESHYPEATKVELKRLRDDLAQFEKNIPEMPTAMGVAEDKVVDVAVHVRGNPLKLGDVVHRRIPKILQTTNEIGFDELQSGRRQLVDSLTDPHHPLTARVFVNRVWRWHLGKGLVRSTDNFGLLGELPSHPELLDRLAVRFTDGGWSVKRLHRWIMNSSTYRQDSVASAEGIERDPENRLFGRADVLRLEAEQVRDALIAVSGRLDRTMGGSLLTVKNRAYFFDHTSRDLTDYNSSRRSIYLPVVRNNVYDVFQLLDYPDAAIPTGDRTTTTVAPQALMMLNSDFMLQTSASMAALLLQNCCLDDTDRIRKMYDAAYAREATQVDVSGSLSFLDDAEKSLTGIPSEQRRRAAWNCLCQIVLASNEFIYLR